MRHELARAGDAANAVLAWVVNQTRRLFSQEFVQSQRGDRIVRFDVIVDDVAVLDGLGRPDGTKIGI